MDKDNTIKTVQNFELHDGSASSYLLKFKGQGQFEQFSDQGTVVGWLIHLLSFLIC